MRKTILHINSYSIGTKLYLLIFKRLDSIYNQTVYVPYQKSRQVKNVVELTNGQMIYSPVLHVLHRIFYFWKMKVVCNDIVKRKLYEGVDLIHAHTLYADGVPAYRLHRKYGIKYVISIRMTDVDEQYRFMLHRRPVAHRVLENAEKVIFISETSKNRLMKALPKRVKQNLETKSVVIPNGINEYYLQHSSPITPFDKLTPFKVLYVGQLIWRKNILSLINAVKMLHNQLNCNVQLTIVGGVEATEKGYFAKAMKRIEGVSYIQYVGEKNKPEELATLFANHHLMALPSINELFGLVYIEAISQNTPVVYCQGEGIEPYVKGEPFAFSVKPFDDKDLVTKIQEAILHYQQYKEPFSKFANSFDWDVIIGEYKSIYKQYIQ